MSPSRNSRIGWIAAAATVMSLVGCTDSVAGAPKHSGRGVDGAAAYRAAPCPDDVATAVLNASCGYVTVPLRHGQDAGLIQVFVTQVEPPTASAAPPLAVIADFSVPNLAGLAPLAQRTNRRVVILTPRGFGHSEPALNCPEVETSELSRLDRPGNDGELQEAFLTAVSLCFWRLSGSGIDPAAFTVAEMAEDINDVRVALGIERWGLVTYGAASKIALQSLGRHPEGVDGLVMDSPEADRDPRLVALESLTSIKALLAACAADAGCASRHPRASRLWADAVASVAAHSLIVEIPAGPTDPALVLVELDPGLLVRLVRNSLGAGAYLSDVPPTAIPQFLEDVAQRRTKAVSAKIRRAVQWSQAYCVGYLSRCLPNQRIALGAYYSVLCHDFSSATAPPSGQRFDLATRTAYVQSPYWSVCARWPVGQAPASAPPIVTGTPTLVVIGEFGSYSSPRAVRLDLSGFSAARVVQVPGAQPLIGSSDCLISFRNDWLDDPTTRPPSCLGDYHLPWETT